MIYLSSLLLIAGVYLLVLASPGPNFFILSQMALNGRHKEARYVVLGLTTGSIFWVMVALAGVATLMSQHPLLSSGVRWIGAAYLVWYGARLLRSAFMPAPATSPESLNSPNAGLSEASTPAMAAAYRTGLLTGVTNPKGAAFWTSAFAALFPDNAPLWFYLATVGMVAGMSLLWHLGITMVFGTEPLRKGYRRIERGINGLAGGALVLLGLQRMMAR